MVIHQFNRIIRNKWIWGACAIAISAFFAFDFLLTGGDARENRASAGELNGEDVSVARLTVSPRMRAVSDATATPRSPTPR